MPYIKTFDRDQMMMCSWDSFVAPDSTARIIDAFVNSLNMDEYGVKAVALEGRPSYAPKGMFKLYIYGYKNAIRSSRKLAKACEVNIEVKWLMGGVEPDFRTISDFRKINIKALKAIFHEFNRRLSGEVEWGFSSVDGTKIQACNSKNNNFTKGKLDDRIKWLNGHIDEYLRILDEVDAREETDGDLDIVSKEIIERRLNEARERLARYEQYQKMLEETGASQLSLTDADSKLMKSKNGFMVAYNPQTAVDSNTHIIRDFQMTNQVTDHGLLNTTMEEIRKNTEGEVVADKGYESSDDMISCLENGIIPHVITDDGEDGYELEIPYEEADVNENSTEPEELSRCLRAGVIPKAYEKVIENIEVREVRRKIREDKKEKTYSPYGTQDEMIARAKEGYFVRDPERNLVYCPAGEVLRQKCIKSNGYIRYANKTACKHCRYRNKCYKGRNEWKEIDFTKDCLEKPCKDWLKAEGKTADKAGVKKGECHYKRIKMVRFFLRPDISKTSQRMCLSEHPFGTIKRTMGATYFLLKGMKKVEGEFALLSLGYNIERARNLLGFNKMMELMAGL